MPSQLVLVGSVLCRTKTQILMKKDWWIHVIKAEILTYGRIYFHLGATCNSESPFILEKQCMPVEEPC
jgi:hypothetical protein